MAILGIDEVGRGSWAGPLVASAVVLDSPIDGLKDSKLLSKKQRESLAELIRTRAKAIGIGLVSPSEIDEYGLTEAVAQAMRDALEQINCVYDEIIIDGNYNFLEPLKNCRCLIKADQLVPEVSAASIIAKVYRDEYMSKLANTYPEYGFESHVGYGTKKHLEALKQYGPTPIHRLSYRPVKVFV